jgi:hypothetical protein
MAEPRRDFALPLANAEGGAEYGDDLGKEFPVAQEVLGSQLAWATVPLPIATLDRWTVAMGIRQVRQTRLIP